MNNTIIGNAGDNARVVQQSVNGYVGGNVEAHNHNDKKDEVINDKKKKVVYSVTKERHNMPFRLFLSSISSKLFLVGIIIILLGVIFFCLIPNVHPDYVSIILAFVGILTTFIVISNYAQVKEVEHKFYKYKNELDERVQDVKNELQKEVDGKSDLAFANAVLRIGHGAKLTKQYGHTFGSYVDALTSYYSYDPDYKGVEVCFNLLKDMMAYISMPEKTVLYITEDLKKNYLSALDNVKDERKDTIVRFILDCPIQKDKE